MSANRIYILGGYQSDFSRNWTREGKDLFELFASTVQKGLVDARLDPKEIQVGHVGNFVAELFTGQGQLGGFFGHVDPAMANMPASRHEAACASGSMAMMAAMADLESGRYDTACVLGIELMRNVSGNQGSENLRPAAWVGKEWQDTQYVWPCAFDNLIDEYERRHGINKQHLEAISEKNFSNARNNNNAQTRGWKITDANFRTNDELNPSVSGRIRRYDCSQITDGAAVLFLANETKAIEYAKTHNMALDKIPQIKGWGHINAPLAYEEKIRSSQGQPYIFPHVQKLFEQTFRRADMPDIHAIDGMEVHDCFNITEYMVIDHCGLHQPGEAWKAVENGTTSRNGALPINMSGGLMGLGHPVGATGIRMALDCYKQVMGTAGDYQIDGAQNMMTFNLGGSATTCASLIIGR